MYSFTEIHAFIPFSLLITQHRKEKALSRACHHFGDACMRWFRLTTVIHNITRLHLLISIVVLLLPLFAYVAMGATWLSTILPSAGIGMQNNFLYQLANFNYLHIGGMSFWTPYVILISAGIELFIFTFLAIHSYCRHQVA